MKKFNLIIDRYFHIVLPLLWCLFLMTYCSYQLSVKEVLVIKEKVDTIEKVLTETLFCERPIVIKERVIRRDTIEIKQQIGDSLMVLPISQKEYSDSTYRAWISGYDPSLDSIQIFQKTNYVQIEKTLTITKTKNPKLVIGPSIVIGITTDGKITPCIGVSIVYPVFQR